MRILIFGGAGYIGTKLSKKLKDAGNYITIYDSFKYDLPHTIRNVDKLINDDVANINKHKEIFDNVDKVIYLISPRLPEIVDDSQVTKELDNLKNVLDLIKENTHFYFTSSCSVYGVSEEIVNESSPVMVTSLYSKLKIESENLIKQYDKLNYIILRLSTLYGEGKITRNDILINNLVTSYRNNEKIDIFDPNASRPHIHIDDCVELFQYVTTLDFQHKVINIGFNELNITKRQLIETIEKSISKNLDVNFHETKDSRSYVVDFSLLKQLKPENYIFIKYSHGLFNLYFNNKLRFSLEDWDSIINYHRPNGSSRTWYLEETGEISVPKMWGNWNVFDTENNNKLFNQNVFKELVLPHFYSDCIESSTKDKLLNKKHIYFINIFDPSFFVKNLEIGFKCMSKEYLEDVKKDKSAIVMMNVMEGYSGCDNNFDLEIIDKWINESELPHQNVHYLSGNLMIDEVRKNKNLNFKCHGVSSFDFWLNYIDVKSYNTIEFKPKNENFYFLSYNRNPRRHRLLFLSKLLQMNLLNYGKVSCNKFDVTNFSHETWFDLVNNLNEIVPIIIDKPLEINWANDMTLNDYEETFVSVVTETLVDKNTLFISEKIWKPIAIGHPFIILGNKGSLKYLKENGFKTFDKWFDESYDDSEDMEEKIEMITNTINSIKNKTVDELIQIREEMREICEYNRNRFIKMVEDKYTFDGEVGNGLKEIQLIIYEIFNSLTFKDRKDLI
jgi:nucleoside-diphosphate-sugar epimerase